MNISAFVTFGVTWLVLSLTPDLSFCEHLGLIFVIVLLITIIGWLIESK